MLSEEGMVAFERGANGQVCCAEDFAATRAGGGCSRWASRILRSGRMALSFGNGIESGVATRGHLDLHPNPLSA